MAVDLGDATWGDDLVDVAEPTLPVKAVERTLPATHETAPDASGVRVRTEYHWVGRGDGRRMEKVTKYIKSVTKVTRISRSARQRRAWPRFGAAAASRDDSNVTIKVHDSVPLEIPGRVTQDADMQAKIMKTLKKGQEQNAFKKQFQKLMGTGDEEEEASGAGGAAGGYSDLARMAIGDMQSKLGMRGGAGVSMEDDQVAIRISNLSKDASADDVRELVAPFGRVARCTVPKNKFMESRGFAYVNFYTKQDAQKCIEGLDGYGYDYLILEVRMAEARRADPGAGGMRHVTGYGKQLPQNLG